jgi:hypothetical protein
LRQSWPPNQEDFTVSDRMMDEELADLAEEEAEGAAESFADVDAYEDKPALEGLHEGPRLVREIGDTIRQP